MSREVGIPRWHPCFDAGAHFSVPRLHLPVARFCNLRCRYCSPFADKSLPLGPEGRPGAARRILSLDEALKIARAFLHDFSQGVVGIAGPGDPLANPETLELLGRVRAEFPHARLCLCTNGLELPRYVGELSRLRLNALTVTVNAVDPEVGSKVYEWLIEEGGEVLYGSEASARLWERQREGIKLASQAGIPVKVNSVLIPGVNDRHLPQVARAVREAGAVLMNIVPLIPAFDFARLPPPDGESVREIRKVCSAFIPQFRLCKQCRADAAGIPGRGDFSCFAFLNLECATRCGAP